MRWLLRPHHGGRPAESSPMRRGLKVSNTGREADWPHSRRIFPDEEGTERSNIRHLRAVAGAPAESSPMRRGLKARSC